MRKIHDVSCENLLNILEYLTAIDIVKCRFIDNKLFSSDIIHRAVLFHIYNINVIINSSLTKLSLSSNNNKLFDSNVNKTNNIIEYLRKREIYCILYIINSPSPLNGLGYWISTNWIANTKKYLDAIHSNLCINNKLNKKQNKIKKRRGIEVIIPSNNMMFDISCCHDNLASTQRKKLIDPVLFKYLRNHYTDGIVYKNSTKSCQICIDNKEKIKSNEKQIKEIIINTINNTRLADLFHRKSGIPTHLLTTKFTSTLLKESENLQSSILLTEGLNLLNCNDNSKDINVTDNQIIEKEIVIETIKEYHNSISINNEALQNISNHQPLIPGLYNIIPRKWLRSWRHYVKEKNIIDIINYKSSTDTNFPMLDCTNLLCNDHGLLLIPTHLEDYLIGIRKHLINGLGLYTGEIVEIVTKDEWEDIHEIFKINNDFGVCFCLDGEDITWNIGICSSCDPNKNN